MMTRAAKALLAALALLAPQMALAADLTRPAVIEKRVVVEDPDLPNCFSPKVFDEMSDAFESKEKEYWKSNLVLLSFLNAEELGYRPWGASFIPRRFCQAETRVSDGTVRSVFYSIGKDTGTLGVKFGVEFCVIGLDRNLAYAPNCRMAQP